MSSSGTALPAGIRASTTGGTPKRGYNCQHCLDYKTIVVRVDAGNGVTVERERPCHCQTDTPEVRP